jgi:hypothetical protein
MNVSKMIETVFIVHEGVGNCVAYVTYAKFKVEKPRQNSLSHP